MGFFDTIAFSFRTLTLRPGRLALTLLGIMIGAASIVLLAGLLQSGEEVLLNRAQEADSADLVQVARDRPPARQSLRDVRPLSRADVEATRSLAFLQGAKIASEFSRESWIRKPVSVRMRLVGATPAALDIYRLDMLRGRNLTDRDLAERARVCLLGHDIAMQVLGPRAEPGARLAFEGQLWTVVGILKDKPTLAMDDQGTWMWNRKVLIPETTFDTLVNPTRVVSNMFVQVSGAGLGGLEVTGSILSRVILGWHRGVKNFRIQTDQNEKNQERLILRIVELLLLSTAVLSLVVGGINIMNIMLVTVLERTAEIGTRRAVGASASAIRLQFLTEATLVAASGGILGVAIGALGCGAFALVIRRTVREWPIHIVPWSCGVGVLLAGVIGIVFGVFPAWKASRLDPVVALRHE